MADPALIQRTDHAAFASIFIYAAAVNALPICLVEMSRDLSFNLTQGGLLGFVSTAEELVVLFLSCFAAARFGKIPILRAALVVVALGLACLSFAESYAAVVALMLVIGLGYAFLEALLTPLVEDLHPRDSGGRMNLLHAFWPIGVCFSVLAVGELLSRGVSWRVAFGGLSVGALAVAFLYPSAKRMDLPQSRADFSHMGEILAVPRFWALGFALFFAGASEVAFAFWAASYIQLHFDALPRAGAVGAAAFALGMVTGRMAGARLARRVGLRRMIVVSAVVAFLLSFAIFRIENLAALHGFMFVMGVAVACFWPSIQSYAARALPVDATVLMIFLSCFGTTGVSTVVLVMGVVGDHHGLRAAFAAAPLSLLFLLVCLAVERTMGDRDAVAAADGASRGA